MKVFFGNRCFCPGLFTSLLALAFFSLFLALGFWQLERAEYKRGLYQSFIDQQAMPPRPLADLLARPGAELPLWRPVAASGRFYADKRIFLDNQVMRGRPGYFLYMPFQPTNSSGLVLVNRGWLPAGPDRDRLPRIATPPGEVLIRGVTKAPPKTGLVLKALPPERLSEHSARVQRLDIKELEAFVGAELAPFVARLTPESGHGFGREWRRPGSGEQTHKGYAFQWFAFAATLALVYLGLNLKKTS